MVSCHEAIPLCDKIYNLVAFTPHLTPLQPSPTGDSMVFSDVIFGAEALAVGSHLRQGRIAGVVGYAPGDGERRTGNAFEKPNLRAYS
jgi:hypothetical protein